MLENLLNLQKQPRKVFPRHFLNAVHCEIGFTGTSVEKILAAEEPLKAMFRAMGYASSNRVVQGHFAMENLPDKPVTVSHLATPVGLVFSSQQPKRDIQILDTKIIISDSSYEGFTSFVGLVSKVCTEVSKFVPRNEINKVGLRKINSILIEPVVSYQDACAIFNPVLFSVVKSGLIPQEALKANEEVVVVERGTHLCVIRTKLQKLPNPNAYEANLDFDFVDLSPSNLEKALKETLPALNDSHFSLFIWAASPELIKLMETK